MAVEQLPHILIKPTGARCNLDCIYCFYLKKETLYAGSRFRMTEAVAAGLLDQLFETYRDAPVVPLAWQGGEPTLMGLDFFRDLTARAKLRLRPGQRLEQSLQTNGLLLDEEWCRWLAEEEVLVGLTIDGTEAMHDAYRVDRRGKGSFGGVIQAAGRLRTAGVAVNAMVTVHTANVAFPSEVYHFLRDDLHFRHIQFVPVVEPVGAGVSDRSVDPVAWGHFLRRIFDLWLERDVGQVFVPTFDAALASWAGLEPALCVFRARCGGALALEHNGDLYACDHFVRPDHLLGNIQDMPMADMVHSAAQVAFGAAKEEGLPGKCRRCPVLFACRGECPKNRTLAEPDGMLNHLCAGYLDFFTHIDAPMRMMAELLRQDRPVPAVMALRRAAAQGLPRQAPCPCESGRKYRHCHGAIGNVSSPTGAHS